MGMQTYPLEERAALVIDETMAAAILLSCIHAKHPADLDAGLRDEIEEGVTYYEAANSETYHDWLEQNDYFDIEEAYDALENAIIYDQLIWCNELSGGAEVADGFKDLNPNGEDLDWDSEPALFLTTKNQSTLFKAAYDNPAELVEEYRRLMEPYLGEDFDYAAHIYDVSGSYYC